ncbi:hypothetical protein RFI_03454 [Reticulomyxa filosa]|uniref:Uncharacterized protein n=1 Tax=Reticulomyxa filosa TaxID=46433 RepID=X6P6A8_RETFI|nr:hypothetical protein RFI_03454 [Reticulomyxa filosa]|eukprot:ETO33648.1 hypothetical protein RFI_03454 [Reticulomyxa filosa]
MSKEEDKFIEAAEDKEREKEDGSASASCLNAFESGTITICNKYAHLLATISSQLGGRQLDNAFQFFIHRFPSYFHKTGNFLDKTDATQFLMKLKAEQLGDVIQCSINRLSDEKENGYNRGRYAELLEKLSTKWNEKQLNDAFNSLKDIFNKNDWYIEALETMTVKFAKQFDHAFNYFISRFKYLLKRIAQRLDEKRMNIALNYCMDKLNDKNNNADVRGRYTELLETIAVNLNGKHFGDAFQCLKNGLKDSKADVQYSCVRSLVTLSKKWKINNWILF